MDKVNYEARHAKDHATIKSDAHFFLSEKAERKFKKLGGWVTALSAIIGTAIFTSIMKNHDVSSIGKTGQSTDWIAIAACILSILATILSALQRFLRFSEIASLHKKSAVNYAGIVRKLENFLITYEVDLTSTQTSKHKVEAIKRLDVIKESILKVDDTAPMIPFWIMQQIRKRHNPALDISADEPKAWWKLLC